MVMRGTAPAPTGVLCGGCQRDVSQPHAPGCPELNVGSGMFADYQGAKCGECGRPEGSGHDRDCNVVLAQFGFQVDD